MLREGRAHARPSFYSLSPQGRGLGRRAVSAVLRHEIPDALKPAQQLVLRLRVRDANVTLARRAECGARQDRNTRFAEQAFGQLTLSESCALDVRKRIERALGPRAADARDGVESIDDQ